MFYDDSINTKLSNNPWFCCSDRKQRHGTLLVLVKKKKNDKIES